jgi:hypothetical protein
MSKVKTLTHQEIERLIADYMQAYRMVYGPVMAESRVLIYKKSWFYFCDKELHEANPKNIIGVPYSAKEIEEMTLMLGRKVPQRDDSDLEEYPE